MTLDNVRVVDVDSDSKSKPFPISDQKTIEEEQDKPTLLKQKKQSAQDFNSSDLAF